MSNARRNQREQRIAREVAAEYGMTYTEALRWYRDAAPEVQEAVRLVVRFRKQALAVAAALTAESPPADGPEPRRGVMSLPTVEQLAHAKSVLDTAFGHGSTQEDDARIDESAPVERLASVLLSFAALADMGREANALPLQGYHHSYPESFDEWLGHAVRLGGWAMSQSAYVCGLVSDPNGGRVTTPRWPADHTAAIAAQGAHSVVWFGAALWSALMEATRTWDDEMRFGVIAQSVISEAGQYFEEVAEESNGFSSAMSALGDAVAEQARSGRDGFKATVHHVIHALAWHTAAVAATCALELAGLDDDDESPDSGRHGDRTPRH